MSEFHIGVVSDLHHGSVYGMLPPDFTTSADALQSQNPGQAYLWECWEDLAERWSKLKLDALVVVGDVIDGKQQAQKGTELCLPLMQDQKRAAAKTLRFLLRKIGKPPLYFVQGTEYHEGKAGEFVEDLANELEAVPYKGLGTGVFCREVLDLEVDGVVINFAHSIGVAGGLYRATPPDREAVWSALAGKEGKMPKADCFVRGHAHYFVHLE